MRYFVTIILWALSATISHAQTLTLDLEIKLIPNVGATWITVALNNTYSDAIIVCTHNLTSAASPSATTRIRNITSNSFELRMQQFENSSVVPISNVHCVISDEGSYDLGSLKYEAHKVLSVGTSGLSVPGDWTAANTENVTGAIIQSYADPHVIGQVMSFNDVNASVFWNFDCEFRGEAAFFSGQADGICIGKHIGQINGTRAPETLGYIVLEAGSGTINGINFETAVGPDIGAGVGNAPPFNYTVSGDFDIGILTQAGEDGGQGGWALLFGADPLSSNTIGWAIEEEVVAGDTSRRHTSENVAYWVFEDNQVANMTGNKTVNLFSGSASPYAIPGSDVIYEIAVENTGSGPVDANSIFLVDRLPAEVNFFNGDIDDGGPETDAVVFTDTDSGLTFNPVSNLGFSNAASAPTSMAQCNYTPLSGYDPAVTFICLSPSGIMQEGTLTPSSFTLQFRAQLE
ncbi:MAG: hypothetical protein ABJG88_07855 [Litorimonas sp.]